MLYPKSQFQPGIRVEPQNRTGIRMLDLFLDNARREGRQRPLGSWSPTYKRQFGALWLAECRRLDKLPRTKHPRSSI